MSAHKPKQPGKQIPFTKGTLRTHVVSRENFSEDIKIIKFKKAKKKTDMFFFPASREKTNLLCNCVVYDISMYIIYVGDWLSILLSSIYYQQLPMKSSEKMLLEVLLPKKIFSGGSWWSKFPRLIWGKRSLDLYYRCFRNPAKKCSS